MIRARGRGKALPRGSSRVPDRGDDLTRGGSRTYRACSCPVLCHRPPAACRWVRGDDSGPGQRGRAEMLGPCQYPASWHRGRVPAGERPPAGRPRPELSCGRPGGRRRAEPGYLDQFELHKQQVEINTSPCVSLDDLAREVTRCRARLAAPGTSPVPSEPAITSKGRYRRMAEHFGLTAHEELTCGCHVHVDNQPYPDALMTGTRYHRWYDLRRGKLARGPGLAGGAG